MILTLTLRSHRCRLTISFLLLNVVLATSGGFAAEFDVTPFHDAERPLANPHKGWYHHFPDNHLTARYPVRQDSDLLEFPGMDHLYMRLAWSYLQPGEHRFAWQVIDPTIKKWTGQGLGIAFRISCRETGTDRIEQQYATPRWVIEAGAQGGYFYKGQETGPEGPWEPDFADPVFLEKLEGFLQAFGQRYDGKRWLRYVDIGSIGDWGEGHTSSGSRKSYGFEQRKVHVDLYRKYFPNTQLVVSDDFVYAIRDPQQRERMHRYVLQHGISYRDDSILVDWYVTSTSDTWCVRSPEFFRDCYLKTPTIFELEHYASVRRHGNWLGKPGSSLQKYGGGKTGADYFRGALRLLHATYIGYHGFAHQWYDENPELTGELLNLCGYWYFLHRVKTAGSWERGSTVAVEAEWENRGVAPAYHAYELRLRLDGPESVDVHVVESGNRRWLPAEKGKIYRERYAFRLKPTIKPGLYALKLKLYAPDVERDVELALSRDQKDDAGYYKIGTLSVK
jgi:hypothetical protein